MGRVAVTSHGAIGLGDLSTVEDLVRAHAVVTSGESGSAEASDVASSSTKIDGRSRAAVAPLGRADERARSKATLVVAGTTRRLLGGDRSVVDRDPVRSTTGACSTTGTRRTTIGRGDGEDGVGRRVDLVATVALSALLGTRVLVTERLALGCTLSVGVGRGSVGSVGESSSGIVVRETADESGGVGIHREVDVGDTGRLDIGDRDKVAASTDVGESRVAGTGAVARGLGGQLGRSGITTEALITALDTG